MNSIETMDEELREVVTRVSDAVQKLDESDITERVILLLIQDASRGDPKDSYKKLPMGQIKRVLQAIRALPAHCFKSEEE